MSNTGNGNSGTPAGWYPDSQVPGQQRYWDGNAWTPHTAPVGPAAQGPQQPATGQQPYGSQQPDAAQRPADQLGQQPAQKKNWFIRHKILSAVLAVFVLIVIISAASGGGSDDTSQTASDQDTTPAPSATAQSTKAAPSPSKKASSTPSAKATPTPKPTPTPTPEAASIPVKAAAIVKEFEDNELAADSKYKGKSLKITGVVDKIDTEIFNSDKYVLQLGTGDQYEFLTVNCHDMSNDDLAKYNKGDTVTVVGDFDDGGDLGVEVNHCEPAS